MDCNNKKISEMEWAACIKPLDIIPIVQYGVNKVITAAQLIDQIEPHSQDADLALAKAAEALASAKNAIDIAKSAMCVAESTYTKLGEFKDILSALQTTVNNLVITVNCDLQKRLETIEKSIADNATAAKVSIIPEKVNTTTLYNLYQGGSTIDKQIGVISVPDVKTTTVTKGKYTTCTSTTSNNITNYVVDVDMDAVKAELANFLLG